jgi:hypothetical protein
VRSVSNEGTSSIMPASSDASEPAAPSFLMARVKAAKEKARNHPLLAPPPAQQDAVQVRQQSPASTAVEALDPKPIAAAAGKATAAAVIRGTLARETDGPLDAQAALALFETHAKDTAALDLLRPVLPAVLETIVAGALVRGTQGFQDRMTLFRMMRVPWTPTMTERGDAKQTDEVFANRLVRAATRVEGRLRRATVTFEMDEPQEARRPATIEAELASAFDGQSDEADRSGGAQ